MMTVRELFALWPGTAMTTIANDCGVSWATANQWRLRNRIPPEYWPSLIESARRYRIKGVTQSYLIESAAAQRPARKIRERA